MAMREVRELCAKLKNATLTYTTPISFELSQNICQHHGELVKTEFREAKQVKLVDMETNRDDRGKEGSHM